MWPRQGQLAEAAAAGAVRPLADWPGALAVLMPVGSEQRQRHCQRLESDAELAAEAPAVDESILVQALSRSRVRARCRARLVESSLFCASLHGVLTLLQRDCKVKTDALYTQLGSKQAVYLCLVCSCTGSRREEDKN